MKSLQSAKVNTLVLAEWYLWCISFADYENIRKTSCEIFSVGVLYVDYVKPTKMSLPVGDDTYSPDVISTCEITYIAYGKKLAKLESWQWLPDMNL